MMKLEDAKAISMKDRGLVAEVKEVVRRFLPTSEVYLYGSVARGTHGPESDYDFLVVTGERLATGDEEAIWDAVFVVEERTADYQTTTGIRRILDNDGNEDDLLAFLEERMLPVDTITTSYGFSGGNEVWLPYQNQST